MIHPLMPRLITANAGMHAADQIALVALPLAAITQFNASPHLIGNLVAAQSAAWLIGSLPGGLLVDRFGPDRIVKFAPLLAILGLIAAQAALFFASPLLLGSSLFVASIGIVFFVLAINTFLPRLLPFSSLTKANGHLELARALVTLPMPSLIAWMVSSWSAPAGFILALVAAGLALVAVIGLPSPAKITPQSLRTPLKDLKEGFAFAWNQPILRGILFCALAWNTAFFALIAIFAPFALSVIELDIKGIGYALSGQGVGLLLGALSAGYVIPKFQPRFILVLSPFSSVFGVLLIALARGSFALPMAIFGFFLVSFAPMWWLICQTSLRQAVTPAPLLGRVNATIQLAIYGIRPIGAIAGGFVADNVSLTTAIYMVIVLFLLSTLAAAVSALGRLRLMPGMAGAQ